ncbi:MAG: flagellar hook-associated protein FlgK [Deltaproteobacteria bacterium]|nr:flagellar hook-associated protein FlgK [Deltaproteobacteria bacterium]
MTGLGHSLNIGSQSLYANQQGINTTAHNISNAQTEGYSRQRLKLLQRDPISKQGVLIGSGVYVGSIDRIHDKFIEKQINLATTSAENSKSRFEALELLGSIFSPELQNTVSSQLNHFFSAWQNLAKYPEEMTVRTEVREQGKNLADAFRRTDQEIRHQRSGLNDYILKTTDEINQTIDSIAHLNNQIREMETGVRNQSNDLRDQRERALLQLSSLVDINYYEDADGMLTIRGPADTLLVDRGRAATFEVRQNGENEGLYDIFILDSEGSSARNITRAVSGGRLEALVHVRDNIAKGLIDHNNNMASEVIRRVNEIHKPGFGLEEYQDSDQRNFFEDVRDHDLAAQEMSLALPVISSTDAISASSLHSTPGDNIIANRIAKIQGEPLFADGNATLNDYFANYVGILGMEAQKVKQIEEADKIILSDLQSRKEAISGVSLDEEATNLIRWQTAFTASSKIITTIDEMYETVLGLKR